MGKKSKSKKKLNYSSQQFIKKVCIRECGICIEGNPKFCFEMYRANPKRFMQNGLSSLADGGRFVNSLLMHNKELKDCSDDEVQYIFEEFICKSGLCGNAPKKCKELTGCLVAFREQIKGGETDIKIPPRIKAKREKQKRKYEKQFSGKQTPRNPTPGFFCNKEFENEIKEILYGDNPGKQDQIEKLSESVAGSTNTQTSNSQS